jgi:hypothetical protein
MPNTRATTSAISPITKRKGITVTLTEDMTEIIRRHMKKYNLETVGVTGTLRMILHQHSQREKFPAPPTVIGRQPRLNITGKEK